MPMRSARPGRSPRRDLSDARARADGYSALCRARRHRRTDLARAGCCAVEQRAAPQCLPRLARGSGGRWPAGGGVATALLPSDWPRYPLYWMTARRASRRCDPERCRRPAAHPAPRRDVGRVAGLSECAGAELRIAMRGAMPAAADRQRVQLACSTRWGAGWTAMEVRRPMPRARCAFRLLVWRLGGRDWASVGSGLGVLYDSRCGDPRARRCRRPAVRWRPAVDARAGSRGWREGGALLARHRGGRSTTSTCGLPGRRQGTARVRGQLCRLPRERPGPGSTKRGGARCIGGDAGCAGLRAGAAQTLAGARPEGPRRRGGDARGWRASSTQRAGRTGGQFDLKQGEAGCRPGISAAASVLVACRGASGAAVRATPG